MTKTLRALGIVLALLAAGLSTGSTAATRDGVSMAASSRNFMEGDGAQSIIVNRVGSTGPVTVTYGFGDGTARNGIDFVGTPGQLFWAAGESGPKSIPVIINDDGAPNSSRSFSVVLGLATGTPIQTPASMTGIILDNFNMVQFSAPTATATEGAAPLTLSVTRTGVTAGKTASVNWTAVDGTALAGTDYGTGGNTTPPSGTLNWGAGVTTPQTISIPIINDTTVEGAKTFTVQLSSPVGTNLAIGTNAVSTVTVNDDDKGVRFSSATYDVFENGMSVVLQVQRIGPATMAASATYSTVNGSAVSGTDFGLAGYTTARTGTLSWMAGDASVKSISIPIINNAIPAQGDRTFTVNLAPGSGLVLGSPSTATVTIHDDDIPAQSNLQFSQPKYIVMENAGNAVLTVQRVDAGGGFSLPATVSFTTMALTAVAATDYTTKSGTLTWAGGETADKTITVPIINNTVAEPTKLFKVVLSKPSVGVGLPAPEGYVVILDDDEVFPSKGAMPAGFSTPGGATAGWHVSNDVGAYEGVFSLKSDEIDDSQTAGLQMSGTFAAGSVIFYVKVSTEAGFDTLQFLIDDVLQTTWSGNATTTWQASPSYPLTAGVHTLKWVYTKDASVSVGSDAVWLDGLKTPAFAP